MTPKRAFGIFLSCTLMYAAVSGATTIRAVSIEEMLVHAELVFEGRVSSTEVRGGDAPSSIHTCAWFEIIEILKGPSVGDGVELCFAGGTRGRFRRKIEGMSYPVRGELGLYFVESLDQRYVSPFYGWQQGHFRAVYDGTRLTREVQVSDGRSVLSVDRTDSEPRWLSTGVARGIRAIARWRTRQQPMTLERFKAKLREILEELR